MVLKNVVPAIICTTLLAWSGLAIADEYRPGEFLGLDLSKAVLSPKPLGPAQQFVPVQLEAKTDRGDERAPARAEAKAEPKIVVHKTRLVRAHPAKPVVHARAEAKAEPKIVVHKTRVVHALPEKPVVHARAEKPRGAVRTKLARRHGNPLDAQAFDTRIQAWPCKSGGICNWKR
jgi:hypothetical protein